MRAARQTCLPPLLLGALLLLLPDAAVDSAPEPACSVKATVLRQIEAPAAAAGVRHLVGLNTCRRADGGGALVTVHFQLAENAQLLAELHEQLPPQNDPAGALGAPGACADVVAQHGCSGGTLPAAVREKIRGSSLAELCPASCPVQGNYNAATDTETAAELLRSPLTQPALGCTRKGAAACPRAVLVSLPTGGPAHSYLLRVYAAPRAAAGAELPMAVELSLVVAPVPWGAPENRGTAQAAAVSLPRRSALLPTPFSAFAAHRAVLASPLRRHLRIGARYNFEVALGADAQAVALVPAQAEQEIVRNNRQLRWVHLAPADDVSPKAGSVRWRGSSVIRAGGGLMLMAQFGSGNYDALIQFEATDDQLLVNGSTGVTGDQAWQTAVRIIPAPGSAQSDLGLQPLSHRYSEIFLDGLHMTMTLATKRAARVRAQISSEQQQIVRVDRKADKENQSCKPSEVVEDSRLDIGAVWEQPRVLITHNGAYTKHTIYVHWDHPDEILPSDSENNDAAGRLLQIYAADLVTADLNQGWPLVLEYSVRVASPRPRLALDSRTVLRGLASSLGGWLTGSNVGSVRPSFVPLKQVSSGDPRAVQRHLQDLPGNATDSVENLALGLCVWDNPAWNYRSIFGWVTKNIEYDEPLLKVLEADPVARRTIRPMEPQEVLAQRRTVCSGYAALTVALCMLCEIPAYSVTGHAKSNARIGTSSAQRLGHAWVAVHLDGRWMLSDPTWASAAIDDESIAQHERWDLSDELTAASTGADNVVAESVVDDYYYLPSAAELLPTHLPEDPQWQLLDSSKPPIDRDHWDNLPKVKPSFWKAGLSPLTISRDADGSSEAAAAAMEQAESAWELCETSAGGHDGWRSLVFNFGQGAPVHCTSVHRAGRRLYPPVASAFTGTSGEWEVVRFGLRVGAPKQIDLLPKVWAVAGAISLDPEEAEEEYMNHHPQQEEESGWRSLASVRREHDEFSVYVVLPTPGIYVLRVYVALGASNTDAGPAADQTGNDTEAASSHSVNQGLQYAHAVDFLLDASAPPPHWADCSGCLYPRMFGAAGAVTLHAPRQRVLRTGHDFNLVLELPSYAREQTLVVRDAGTGREVQLHRTTIGALLGVPKFVRVAYAGSFRCTKPGVVTVFTRWRGDRQMRAVMEFECRSDGHAPVPGTGGVMPPSNVIDDATTSIRCERLACLPVLPNVAFIQDAGVSLGFALVSHTAAAWSVTTAETEQVVVSTTVPSTVSAQLKEAGVSDTTEDPGVYTLVSSSDGGRRHTVEFRCRRPWRYDLLIFAGLRATLMGPAPHALPLIVQYTVDATPARSDHERASSASGVTAKQQAQQFPRVFAEFSSCGGELLHPRTRKLSAGHRRHNFSLILGVECEATAVAVIQAGRDDSAPQWTYLRAEADNTEESAVTSSSDTRGVGSDSERNPRDAAAGEARPVRWTGTVDALRAGLVHIAAQLVAVAPEERQRQRVQGNSAQYRHLVEYTVEI